MNLQHEIWNLIYNWKLKNVPGDNDQRMNINEYSF